MAVEIYSGDHHDDQEHVEAYWCWDDCKYYKQNIGYEIDGCGWYSSPLDSYFW